MVEILKIEHYGDKGDKRKPWGYSMGVSMTSIIGFVEAEYIHEHWVLRVRMRGGFVNYDEICIEGIVCGDKIDKADEEMYKLMKSKLVYPTMSGLKSDYPDFKVKVNDRTKHAEK